MQTKSINNTPSFCGITRYLNREIYDLTKTQKQILYLPDSEFVGQLPSEMLTDIIKFSKSPEIKRKNILNIMNAFSEVSKIFSCPHLVENEPLTKWERFINLFKPKDKKHERLKYSCSARELEGIEKIINAGAKKLTQSFRDAGLLKKREKISIDFLGKGCSGSAFKVNFPKRTKYKSKILKIFSKSELERKQHPPKMFNTESFFHEINSMIFVKNKHKHKGFQNSEYIEGYFASLKNRFMLLENAFNYKTKEINEHDKLDHKLGLMLWDKSTEGNVLNGRMVDYGYIQQFGKMSYFLKKNPGIRK